MPTPRAAEPPPGLRELDAELDGEARADDLSRMLYATDASVYRRLPAGVVFPKGVNDLRRALRFAAARGLGIVPRAAGTSLAGQCVGDGLVVDVSRHLTRILAVDPEARTATVEPGVIRDDLNRHLAPRGLFFSPNTSTSDRCTLGGMAGNNSCGSTSIRYGDTRAKLAAVEALLADGTAVAFGPLTRAELAAKLAAEGLEGDVYRAVVGELSDPAARARIRRDFPRPEVTRRNTGYALDALIDQPAFDPGALARAAPGDVVIDLCPLLAGSEGTLAVATALTVRLDPLPPPHAVLVVPHFASVQACLEAVSPAMGHRLYACEMIDRTILELTRRNPEQAKNRFFLAGDPAAVLLLELRADTEDELRVQLGALLATLDATDAYARPALTGEEVTRAMTLRAAGLGILGNMVGDAKAVACIEDTAVAVADLAPYIAEFTALMERHGVEPVYYAHAGAGELHLRPVLDLKRAEGVREFRAITDEVAALVKRYGGSMSGEHGDGIVRAGYIPLVVGAENHALMGRLKRAFDPAGLLNPGKVIDPYPMTEALRYEVGRAEPEIPTALDFSEVGGILRMAEKCNGAGTCRKPAAAGGTMCPSYRATRDERHGTRGRANALREVLTNATRANRFDDPALAEAFDLCLSCKACASECPSTVDVAALKAEWQYQVRKAHGTSLRTRLFARNDELNRLARLGGSRLANAVLGGRRTSAWLKRRLGVAPRHDLPRLSPVPLRRWLRRHLAGIQPAVPRGEVYLFVDEFTDQLDADVGIDAAHVLTGLGYRVRVRDHARSGRAYLSKGFLDEARAVAERNVAAFAGRASAEIPLIGIEPSAILTFRDEYPRLAADRARAEELGRHALLVDEFLAAEIRAGRVTEHDFTTVERRVRLHGHCHQKALSDVRHTAEMLSAPPGYHVEVIPSGCCGMAGSFGYEAEHFEVSMAIGEQTLFPAVRAASADDAIAAPGTSCRHQIRVGAGRAARHPVSLLRDAMPRPSSPRGRPAAPR